MLTYKNLILLGTSHIAKQSIEEVKKIIEEENPKIIALELDKKRLHALLHKKKEDKGLKLRDIRRVGFKGFIFSLIGEYAEKKLGEQVGVKPGEEMLTAVKLAKEKSIHLAFVDQDIEITLKKLSKHISWKEKFRFLGDIVKSIFKREPEVQFDLKTVPSEEVIKTLTKRVEKDYPNVYKVLVSDRNEFMAKKIAQLMREREEKIFAIVGAGHEKEMMQMIKEHLGTLVYSYSFSYED